MSIVKRTSTNVQDANKVTICLGDLIAFEYDQKNYSRAVIVHNGGYYVSINLRRVSLYNLQNIYVQ